MFGIYSKITRHKNKQESTNHNEKKNRSKPDPVVTDGNQLLADKDMKIIILNVFYVFKNISTGREDILKTQTELLEVKI